MTYLAIVARVRSGWFEARIADTDNEWRKVMQPTVVGHAGVGMPQALVSAMSVLAAAGAIPASGWQAEPRGMIIDGLVHSEVSSMKVTFP